MRPVGRLRISLSPLDISFRYPTELGLVDSRVRSAPAIVPEIDSLPPDYWVPAVGRHRYRRGIPPAGGHYVGVGKSQSTSWPYAVTTIPSRSDEITDWSQPRR